MVSQTVCRSDETFTQESFPLRLDERPASDLNHYELLNGRIVPTLVIEILSPATARRDRTEKRAICARNGIDEYWLVDPDRRCITVCTLAAGTYDDGRTFEAGPVRSSVLPGLAVNVEDVCTPA